MAQSQKSTETEISSTIKEGTLGIRFMIKGMDAAALLKVQETVIKEVLAFSPDGTSVAYCYVEFNNPKDHP